MSWYALLATSATPGAFWLLFGTRALMARGASSPAVAANIVRAVLASVAFFLTGVAAHGSDILLIAGLAIGIALAVIPLSIVQRLDLMLPDRRLLEFARRAARIAFTKTPPGIDSAALNKVIRQMSRIQPPQLAALRDLLIWRYLTFWDPAQGPHLIHLLREIRIDELEMDVWGRGLLTKRQLEEREFSGRLSRAITELAQEAHDSQRDDGRLLAARERLAVFTRPDTIELLAEVEEWLTQGCPPGYVARERLPRYPLVDGAAICGEWLIEGAPAYGTKLTSAQLDVIEAARVAAVDRIYASQHDGQLS